jgi:hypothetical protein
VTGWLPDGTSEWGGRAVARTVADALPRCRAVLTGSVASTAVRWPVSYDAVLNDGTGAIVVRWVGRESVPGVVVGALLTVEGTVSELHGHLVVLNPLYRFDPSVPVP